MAANESLAAPGFAAFAGDNHQVPSTFRANLGAAAGLLTVGAIGYGMKRPIQKWWRHQGQLPAPAPAPDANPGYLAGRSTHLRLSRATTRVRRPLQPR
jgi:hypothetical protein